MGVKPTGKYAFFTDNPEAQAIMVTVGANVKRARLSKGWSRVDLSSASGVSYNTVDNIERGIVNASIVFLVLISRVTGWSMDKLTEQPRD